MSEQNAFNRSSLDIPPMAEPQGLLEQFNLPPALIQFLRSNSKIIWVCIAVVSILVAGVSLYGGYRDYRINQAASALDFALQSEGNKEALLENVSSEFSSTPSAKLAKIELARYFEQQQQYGKAVALLAELNSTLPEKALLKPLITLKLAGLYEQQGNIEMAMGEYTVLAQRSGFETTAYKAMGLIHERQGQKEQAVAMYRKFIEHLEGSQDAADDPSKVMIETRLALLEK